MKKAEYLLTAVVLMAGAMSLSAQTRNFNLAKWVEIQNSILKELDRTYVDSLPIARMQSAGIEAMLEELDPYTVYIPEEENEDLEMMINKSYGGVGAVIFKPETDGNVIINEPYANSPAAKAGLVCGDEILAIDGLSTHGLDTKGCSDRMKGKAGTTVVLTVKKIRSGDTLDVNILRERIHLPDVTYAGMLNDTTGYIQQTGFTEGVSSDIRNAYYKLKKAGMKKLILDLRGNGGGLMHEAINIVSLFVPNGSLVVTQKGKSSDFQQEYRTEMAPVDIMIPLVILVDSGSASSSEIVAGALQDMDRAVIMGRRTYGKGLVQTIRPLPYNGQLKITTSKYYTPSGRCVQAIDYAQRNEDGSVGHIPDSLTHEFKTLHGRTVRDGGGITPDVVLENPEYSRLVYSIVLSGVTDQYAIEYARKHDGIPSVDEFHFSDADYEDFIGFAKTKEFDYRTTAKALFDQMKTELQKDGLAEGVKEQLDALDKAIDLDKEQLLRTKKQEIIPFIEEEIVTRYYFQEGGVRLRLRYDEQLHQADAHPIQ